MIGDNKENYTYVNKNIFDNKINYSYSKFGGIEFIKSWGSNRKECLEILFDSSDAFFEKADNCNTNIEFQKWLNYPEVLLSELDKVHLLIKRFEVTKKIYETYDENYRCLNKQVKYNNLSLYINFGLIMVKLYYKFQHLQYANTLLKLVDIICSELIHISPLKKTFNYENARILLNEERKIIINICSQNKIEL
jgi:hypothetical protein